MDNLTEALFEMEFKKYKINFNKFYRHIIYYLNTNNIKNILITYDNEQYKNEFMKSFLLLINNSLKYSLRIFTWDDNSEILKLPLYKQERLISRYNCLYIPNITCKALVYQKRLLQLTSLTIIATNEKNTFEITNYFNGFINLKDNTFYF